MLYICNMKDKRKKYRVVIEFVVDNERDEGADECLARAYYGEPGDQYVHMCSYKQEEIETNEN